MPYRLPKDNQFSSRRRPSWSKESDYWLREKQRLALVQSIRKAADSFRESGDVCPGCDFPIWEARNGDILHRGCHCGTVFLPPGHGLREFDPKLWAGELIKPKMNFPSAGRARGPF